MLEEIFLQTLKTPTKHAIESVTTEDWKSYSNSNY
jgi:hypothetical protein